MANTLELISLKNKKQNRNNNMQAISILFISLEYSVALMQIVPGVLMQTALKIPFGFTN